MGLLGGLGVTLLHPLGRIRQPVHCCGLSLLLQMALKGAGTPPWRQRDARPTTLGFHVAALHNQAAWGVTQATPTSFRERQQRRRVSSGFQWQMFVGDLRRMGERDRGNSGHVVDRIGETSGGRA